MNIPLSPPLAITTVADLIRHLGDIPAERIRMKPLPGTATEADVIAVGQEEDRLCELVDGILVEKTVGFYEGRLAVTLAFFLERHVFEHDLGAVCGADAAMRLKPGLVRIPDVSFVSRARLPDRKIPTEPIPDLIPDLAVEVLSKGNTPKEMQRKLREYFTLGVRQVWFVDGKVRQVRVYRGEKKSQLLEENDTLRGGRLLPGFTLRLKELFDRTELRR
jgi:Uma2 family endonuclease